MAHSDNTVTEDELARLAGHILIGNLEQIAVQFLGLTKIEVASCRYNAQRNTVSDNFAWTSVFYCLMQWKKITTRPYLRNLLYEQLHKASEKGLIAQHHINFLQEQPAAQFAREFHKLEIESKPQESNILWNRKGSITLVQNEFGDIVQRELCAANHVSTVDNSKTTTYKVTVKTSDIPFAGTDAKVFIKLQGRSGDDSDDLPLKKSGKDLFEQNQTDVFVFEDIPSVGEITHVKVWHDNSGSLSDWHLEYILIEETTSGKVFPFPCDNWLGKSYKTTRMLSRVDTSNDQDEIDYKITVTTSNFANAGMVHNVYIAFDEKSITKAIILEYDPEQGQFNQGQTSTFSVKHADVGHLKTCWIGAVKDLNRNLRPRRNHDDRWHCKKITIVNTVSDEKYIFVCGEWLPITNHISREYVKLLHCRTVKYEVAVVTSRKLGAGTDANVTITLCGSGGNSGKQALTKKHFLENLFERGKTDVFKLDLEDVGDISQIVIEHDCKGLAADWYLDRVDVTDLTRNNTWCFKCSNWLRRKDGTNKRTLVLKP